MKKKSMFITTLAALGGLCVLGVYETFLPPVPKKRMEDHKEEERQAKPVRFALLLGCSCYDDGSVSNSQKDRCDLAMDAWNQDLYDVLIISGGAVKNDYIEAYTMRDYIRRHGGKDIPILCEIRAENTWQNFEFVKDMTGDIPLLVLTGSLHARRSAAIARQFFSDVTFCTYPDRKPKHFLREIQSRALYIGLELKKMF